ncbi:hypothetical protein WAA39_002330 [Enterobacter mori]|jgi:hypothetical protein|uniref:hypothetical protein n=1 Tax=Enterobacter mori TaxID=539813 RepID=UPI0025C90DE7|nr:hypothetical protein [Enterobacter mori]EME8859692.1 hypothetical protein [Enterobacter mori]
MDISARPKTFQVLDFKGLTIDSSSKPQIQTKDLESLTAFPSGDITKDSQIFVFSLTCHFSADAFVHQIVPAIAAGKTFILANYTRSDNDLNLWVRIAKLKAIHRIPYIANMYKEAVTGKLKTYKDVQKYFDKVLANVSIDHVNPYFSAEGAAISALFNTGVITNIYGVKATPYTGKVILGNDHAN